MYLLSMRRKCLESDEEIPDAAEAQAAANFKKIKWMSLKKQSKNLIQTIRH